MHFRRRFTLVAATLGATLAALAGCQASQPASREPHASGEKLSDTDAADMAAEDAENLNLEKSSTQPARRPPPPRQRRPVDQPRIRG